METGRSGVTNEISEEDEFFPLERMPTSRLQDIYNDVSTKSLSVINLDAVIPPVNGYPVLRTLLEMLNPSVKTLSLRFNNLTAPELCSFLINWLSENENIEMLYLMGTGIEEKRRILLEAAWKKHMKGHRTDNMGYTFIRVPMDAQMKPDD
jgi:hypothetical protein